MNYRVVAIGLVLIPLVYLIKGEFDSLSKEQAFYARPAPPIKDVAFATPTPTPATTPYYDSAGRYRDSNGRFAREPKVAPPVVSGTVPAL